MDSPSKNYDPSGVEAKWYARWLDKGYFKADEAGEGEPYTIVIPPPNVTGILHMGHALNNTIQDVLIRWKRMAGFNTVWVPGTDHASIATEQKVVRKLESEGIPKSSLTRESFLEHAWEWKEEYGGRIINQLKKLGCSCDWDRTRFTMDDHYHDAVLESFVKLYEKGLIYRGHRLVNWCPVSRSAISDEEVFHREINGKLWHFRYPIKDSDEYVVVATTRPETMLGDTAVAINPNDERYKHLIGRTIMLPLVGREMPIILDDHVDPEFGTGCVKITPAHDPNDFEMGETHGLEFINIMNDDATLNDRVPEKYRGMTREDARKAVVADLDDLGLLDRIEDYQTKVGYSQRGDVPIEFYMSEQWFMKMDELAAPALKAVLDEEIKIHPQHWVKTYSYWMENIRDWCISRQLWWGHRIPVWYKKGTDRNDPANRHCSVQGPSDPENWEQDEDVLDTWASSWLWPFAVHEWPGDGPSLQKYYPSNVLATGPDILFFWVARMIMAGYEFMGEKPFTDVYLHGIVRDDKGQKMSKSLGNSLDPLEIIEEFSADALRFSLMMLTATGQDVYISHDKFEVGRNFGTKIWNACRFMLMKEDGEAPDFRQPAFELSGLSPDDQHILSKLAETVDACAENLDKFRFNDYALSLYDFMWHHFCDWYIEKSKGRLYGDDDQARRHTLDMMHYVLANALRLLHPLMPFLTEELWHVMGYAKYCESIMIAPWPGKVEIPGIESAKVEYVEAKHDTIRLARNIKADFQIPAGKKVNFLLKAEASPSVAWLKDDLEVVMNLMRAESLVVDSSVAPSPGTPSVLTPLGTLYLPLEGLVDVEKETARIQAQLAETEKFIKNTQGKLANEKFVSNAPEAVVQKQRDLLEELSGKKERLEAMLVQFTGG